jgi:cytochrome P450
MYTLGLILLIATLSIVMSVGYIYLKYRKHAKLVQHIPGENQFLFPSLVALLPKAIQPLFKKIQEENLGDIILKGKDLFKKYKSPVVKYAFSTIPLVFVGDAEFSKQFVKEGSRTFVKDGFLVKFLNDRLGNNVFSVTDESIWKRHRTLLNYAFTDKMLIYVADNTIETVRDLLKEIESNPIRNVDIDMSNLTMDVIGTAGFGYKFKAILEGNRTDTLAFMFKDFLNNFFKVGAAPGWMQKLPFGIFERVNKAVDANRQAIVDIIASRKNNQQLAEAGKPKDILQLLLDAATFSDPQPSAEDKHANFTEEELISNCFAFLIAGHDTTGTISFNSTYIL